MSVHAASRAPLNKALERMTLFQKSELMERVLSLAVHTRTI